MGLLSNMQSLDLSGRNRRASDVSTANNNGIGKDVAPPSGNPNDTEVLDKDEGNLLLALISQSELGVWGGVAGGGKWMRVGKEGGIKNFRVIWRLIRHFFLFLFGRV